MNVKTALSEALQSLESQDFEAAVRFCRQGLYQAPDMSDLHMVSAHAYWRSGKPREALQSLTEAARRAPGARLWCLLAAMRSADGDQQGAVAAARNALEREPLQLSVRFNLATYLAMQGEVASAIQEYQELLRLEPDCVQAHNNLGALLSCLGDPDGAIVSFERAQKACPTDPVAALNLAREWAYKDDLEQAEAALRGALLLAGDRAETHALAGWIFSRSQRFAEAEQAYRRALDLGIDRHEIRELHRQADSKRGRPAQE